MEEITSPKVPPHDSLSRAIKHENTVYVSGSGPFDSQGKIVGTDIGEQTEVTMEGIEALLKETGLSLNDVVKTTVYLKNMKRDYAEFDATYETYFSEPYPVRTTSEAGDLGSSTDKLLLEVDAMAVIR